VSPPSARANGSLSPRGTPPLASSPTTSFQRAPARTQGARDAIRAVKEEGKKEKVAEKEEKDEMLQELCQRLLADMQDIHSVRTMLNSFHRPLTATGILSPHSSLSLSLSFILELIMRDTQYLSLEIIRQMEYLNLCLQEVSALGIKEDERSDTSSSDEYIEEVRSECRGDKKRG
jgi:hypothetical protein